MSLVVVIAKIIGISHRELDDFKELLVLAEAEFNEANAKFSEVKKEFYKAEAEFNEFYKAKAKAKDEAKFAFYEAEAEFNEANAKFSEVKKEFYKAEAEFNEAEFALNLASEAKEVANARVDTVLNLIDALLGLRVDTDAFKQLEIALEAKRILSLAVSDLQDKAEQYPGSVNKILSAAELALEKASFLAFCSRVRWDRAVAAAKAKAKDDELRLEAAEDKAETKLSKQRVRARFSKQGAKAKAKLSKKRARAKAAKQGALDKAEARFFKRNQCW